ncbi:sorting nexin-4-like isoform X1 [Takifugu rubripes]|uniref:sorting nexin-4-like isoform X1 n=1 Tax=Takifugu rubripes TaxID=31033 RepID=UPI0005D16C1D|nr:sorting nexin-4-like isoform X1 [Takifugu rubripes]|eukprot:XP_011609091.1 PREDICTED: sorting nexin-4-like isoform X1 [Takifugu rubripes]
MMADSESIEEVAVIGNTDITPTEAENNIVNTVMVERGTSLLKKMEISVAEAEKRTGKNTVNMQETYTVYLIETRPAESVSEGGTPATPDTLWRRYSEFELLRTYLLVTYPYIIVPPLPEKRAEFVWHKLSADNLDPDFVERRRVGLENFLLRVASHPVLSNDKIFFLFLTEEKGWREAVLETGFQDKVDSRLKSLNATFRVKNPDKRFTDLKQYSDELNTVISQLLRARAKVADRLYGVYKVHGNYGRVFSEWSAIEKEMGDGLQSAGHHMDTYAASIDDILEEEEHYADQLKEYFFYTDAVRAVCRKHELIQYELELAAQDLAYKKQQKEELVTGTVRVFSLKGMTSKLFGQESQEQRESRLTALEQNIQEGEAALKQKNAECREFVQTAWEDIERFKEQKNKDLHEALISYAIMQISMCKKGIQVWSNAKECFNKM